MLAYGSDVVPMRRAGVSNIQLSLKGSVNNRFLLNANRITRTSLLPYEGRSMHRRSLCHLYLPSLLISNFLPNRLNALPSPAFPLNHHIAFSHLPEKLCTGLGRSFLCLEVNVNNSIPVTETRYPLEVIHRTPVEVAFYRYILASRAL